MKNKKGFTLVELIVVLVILVILAAIAVPSFMQYITMAQEQQGAIEARSVLLAADILAADALSKGTVTAAGVYATDAEIKTKAGVSGTVTAAGTYADGKISDLKYTATNTDVYEINIEGNAMVKQP